MLRTMCHWQWLISDDSLPMSRRKCVTVMVLVVAHQLLPKKRISILLKNFDTDWLEKSLQQSKRSHFCMAPIISLFFPSVYTTFLVTLKPDCNNFNLQLFIVLCPSNHMINNNYDPIVRARDLRIINDPNWNFATRPTVVRDLI